MVVVSQVGFQPAAGLLLGASSVGIVPHLTASGAAFQGRGVRLRVGGIGGGDPRPAVGIGGL